MTHHTFHSSRPDKWVNPRPYSDANMRRAKHGKIIPMQQRGFWARLFLGAE